MSRFVIQDACLYQDRWKADLASVERMMRRIPEFDERYSADDISRKLYGNSYYGRYLALIATERQVPKAFSIAYSSTFYKEIEPSGNLYLWLAGTVPVGRCNGLMSALLKTTEWWACAIGYESMSLKTFTKFKDMHSLVRKLRFKRIKDHWDGARIFRKHTSRLHWSQLTEFNSSEVCKASDFVFDTSWNIKAHVESRIDNIEYDDGESRLGIPSTYRLQMKSGEELHLLSSEKFRDFKKDDHIVYAVNHKNEFAWLEHPGVPLYLRNVSLEKRLNR